MTLVVLTDAAMVRAIPPGRPGDPAGASLLGMPDAGAYITGQTLSIDGGWNPGVVGA
jgi:NAD(P)-dependent dehydrogenase (short-subunit alcohol dehydrogenase family)